MLRVTPNERENPWPMPTTPSNIRTERHGPHLLHLTPETDSKEILDILNQEGTILKQTNKRLVMHVGSYVLKSRRDRGVLGTFRHTFLRGTYRRGWEVALRLHDAGIGVPKPRALYETRWKGLITGNVLISDYVPNLVFFWGSEFAPLEEKVPHEKVQASLKALSNALNRILDAGVYLRDLSRSNILTTNGSDFFFVDLDDAELDVPYTRKRRMRNHVHLYRQFRMLWPRATIEAFIRDLLPDSEPPAAWLDLLEDKYAKWCHQQQDINVT